MPGIEVWLKLERANPGASIKDRIGIAMIDDAERRGALKKGGVIVEPTSGNTGIGLAMAAAVKGYRCILVMPETMSVERRRVMAAYGAELVLTAKELGTKGAIDKAQGDRRAASPARWVPNQFDNPANVDIHRRTTAQEILKDFPDGIDYLITGVGTGGHITGVAEVLKKTMPNLKVFAVEPEKSSVDRRWHAHAAQDPGDRHRLHPGQPAPATSSTARLGDGGGRVRVRRPRGEGGGDLHRHLVRRVARRRGAEASRDPEGEPRAHLLLRHGRAVSVDRGAVPRARGEVAAIP